MISQLEDFLINLGILVVNIVIWSAGQLTKSESSPGLVAITLVIALVVISVFFINRTAKQKNAILEMDNLISQYKDVPEFSDGFSQFQNDIREMKTKSEPWKSLCRSWGEFSETIITDEISDPVVLRNSVRPSTFLNTEDLGFGTGFYRVYPNAFVSVGLLLTFLGLVAALHEFSQSMSGSASGGMDSAMTNFMQIASAKFIMSLVGLLCSIILTLLIRRRSGGIERALNRVCQKIEERLSFVSLEDIGFRQLKATTEQRDHMREIGFGMVEELRKPLDILPEKISRSISDKMDPLFDKVSSMGASSMEGMVGDLSTQLSNSVGAALTRASESLGEATDRIGLMVDRMNSSNAQAGDGLQTALKQMTIALSDMRSEIATSGQTASSAMTEGADKLLGVMNETLSGIRENTSQGADAMRTAADDMRKAAESFREQLSEATADGVSAVQLRMEASSEEAGATIEGAGRTLLASFDHTSQEIARLGTEMGDTIGEELLSKLQSVSTQLSDFAEAIQKGASGAQIAASGMQSSAQSLTGAASSFDAASQDMIQASEPLRLSHERIESGLRNLGTTVDTVAETLTKSSAMIAENASHVMETAGAALGTEREGIHSALEATRAALAQLSTEAEKLDQIDEMLGRALQEYNNQLDSALGSAQDHITEMRKTLAPGIDTLRGVVEQAESFLPAQSRKV
ncbi:MAG: hypothetical protein AB8G77_13610 [Rhodothermales bacterium]